MSLNFKDLIKNKILFLIFTSTTISDISDDPKWLNEINLHYNYFNVVSIEFYDFFDKNNFLIIFCFLIFSQSVLIRKSCAILEMN